MTEVNKTASAEYRSFVERIERLEEEKKNIQGDIKAVFDELHGAGYDKKATRKIIRARRQDPAERVEEETIFETYKTALGIE
uniref:GapR-like DNA-binding domain-containing protein n=1 Tax=Rhizobium phage IG49 TaxID=3129228 RepID=A0AAU8HYW6_9CAUD